MIQRIPTIHIACREVVAQFQCGIVEERAKDVAEPGRCLEGS